MMHDKVGSGYKKLKLSFQAIRERIKKMKRKKKGMWKYRFNLKYFF